MFSFLLMAKQEAGLGILLPYALFMKKKPVRLQGRAQRLSASQHAQGAQLHPPHHKITELVNSLE